MTTTLSVRFQNSPRLHPMRSEADYEVGTQVVVQGRRGPEIATVRGHLQDPGPKARFGAVLRAATAADLKQWAALQEKAEDLKWFLRARVRELGLPVKIVAAELTLDESLLTLNYSAEERLDLSRLITEVRSATPARVNFVAAGPREQAVLLGALGGCGRENCSAHHLQDFAPVTIRMARDQQLPLNPEKLSGPCGRLMCCLQYEHPQYLELLGQLPRRGARVCHSESGACGKVSKLYPLQEAVDVQTEDGLLAQVPVTSLKPAKAKAPPKTAK